MLLFVKFAVIVGKFLDDILSAFGFKLNHHVGAMWAFLRVVLAAFIVDQVGFLAVAAGFDFDDLGHQLQPFGKVAVI